LLGQSHTNHLQQQHKLMLSGMVSQDGGKQDLP
jgi:hypothetical protein